MVDELPNMSFMNSDMMGEMPGVGQGSGGAQQRIRRRNRMITSCLECRRRKLKCDKGHPCRNCTKFGRDCVFLAPALDPSSQLKLTEIKEKVGSLEKLLERDVAKSFKENAGWPVPDDDENDLPIPEDEQALEATPLATTDAAYEDDGDDLVLDLGIQLGRMRLTERIGGFFRPKISEELKIVLTDIRNDRRSEEEKTRNPDPAADLPGYESFLQPGPTYIAPASGFFYGPGAAHSSLIEFLPSKNAADRLIRQYFMVVHPLVHTVHRQSFEESYAIFWQHVNANLEPAGSLQAVVFAAMFSGVVSMPEETILLEFGVPKASLIDNFRAGTEGALCRAKFLQSTKTETLQAFVMYLVPLCRDQVSRAHSALVGMAIRIAECMGLHRDGETYGLTPLETHIRRLVWWQLAFLDVRTCEAQGPRPQIRKDTHDVQLPLNVDDQDFLLHSPPVQDRELFTDATLFNIRVLCNEMHRVVWHDRPRIEKKQMSLTALLSKVESWHNSMKARFHYLDDNVPLQRLARLILSINYHRLHISILHRYHNGVSVRIPDRLRQIILTSGTKQLEDAITVETDPELTPWAWYAGTYQQWHTAFLLLIEIWAYPRRKEADRIWACLDYIFLLQPNRSRDVKARQVLTELRDRTGAYQARRKMKLPAGFAKRLGTTAPRPVGSSSWNPDVGLQTDNMLDGSGSDARAESNVSGMSPESADSGRLSSGVYSISGVADGQILMNKKMTPEYTDSGRSYSGSTRSPSQPREGPPVGTRGGAPQVAEPDSTMIMDDLMLPEIDWNEWDKLFPSSVYDGQLDLPHAPE